MLKVHNIIPLWRSVIPNIGVNVEVGACIGLKWLSSFFKLLSTCWKEQLKNKSD